MNPVQLPSLCLMMGDAEAHLFAGLLQTSIRTDDNVSAALDGLFSCQTGNSHSNLKTTHQTHQGCTDALILKGNETVLT